MQIRHWSANTYVDQLMVVSLLQVMEDRSIVKIGQIGHIFGFLVFWWIDLLEKIFLKITGLNIFSAKRELYISENRSVETYVNEFREVALLEIVQDGCLI